MDQPLELVHEAALTPGSLVSKICNARVLGVNSTHHQGVLEPAEPFTATARSRDGIVEAMELKPENAKIAAVFVERAVSSGAAGAETRALPGHF